MTRVLPLRGRNALVEIRNGSPGGFTGRPDGSAPRAGLFDQFGRPSTHTAPPGIRFPSLRFPETGSPDLKIRRYAFFRELAVLPTAPSFFSSTNRLSSSLTGIDADPCGPWREMKVTSSGLGSVMNL